MIPVVFFISNNFYTVLCNDKIIRGRYVDSSLGELNFRDVKCFDISGNNQLKMTEFKIDYSEIISLGFCCEERNETRSNLCWELNSLTD